MSSKARKARGARSAAATGNQTMDDGRQTMEVTTSAAQPPSSIARRPSSAAGQAARQSNRLLLIGGAVVALLVLAGLVFFGAGLWRIGINPVPPTYSPEGRIAFVRQTQDGKRD